MHFRNSLYIVSAIALTSVLVGQRHCLHGTFHNSQVLLYFFAHGVNETPQTLDSETKSYESQEEAKSSNPMEVAVYNKQLIA
jgi:hypothetical protein